MNPSDWIKAATLITQQKQEAATADTDQLSSMPLSQLAMDDSDPPAAALPTVAKGTTVPGLYSHIAHSNDKDKADIPQPFTGAHSKQSKPRGRGKGKQPQQKPKIPAPQTQDDPYNYEDTNNYYHNDNYRGQSRGHRPYRGQNTGHSFRGQNFHGRGQRNQNTYCYIVGLGLNCKFIDLLFNH